MRRWSVVSTLMSCLRPRSTLIRTRNPFLAKTCNRSFTLMVPELPKAFNADLITRQRHKRSTRRIEPEAEAIDEFEDFVQDHDQQRSSYASSEEEFNALCEQYPQLHDYDPGAIIHFLEFMSMHGFTSNKTAEMVLRYPSILASYEEQIPRATDFWRSLGCDEKDLTRVLFRHPQLLDYTSSKIRTRFAFLSGFFTRKETLETVVRNVQVIWDSEADVGQKLNYLLKGVCHKAASIAKTKTLSYSFLHIRTRHEFLIRAGLFVPVSYFRLHKQSFSKDASVVRDKYFTPADIVCTHDKEFVRKCTKGLLTLNELATFEELFSVECEKKGLLDLEEPHEENESKGRHKNNRDVDEDGENEDISSKNSTPFFNKKDSVEFYF